MTAMPQPDTGHVITPVAGSARQLAGSPADLGNPAHYPVEALCSACSRPVRSDRHFRRTWYHVAAFTMQGATGASS